MKNFLKKWKGFVLTACLVSGMFVLFTYVSVVYGAAIQTASIRLSNQKVSQESNFTLEFTTPTGVSAGQTITLAAPSGFSIGSVNFTDIDLEDDGVDLALAATASGATWGASFSGQTLTITSGTGTIAGGSVITIEIGLNATFGVAGDARMTNPSSAATYLFTVSGTFGDVGNVYVAIVNNGSVSVEATVGGGAPVVSSGGGGVAEPPIVPRMFNLTITEITETSAVISWETDIVSIGYVDIGTTLDYLEDSQADTVFGKEHEFTVTDLEPGTLYHVKIRSQSQEGGVETVEGITFTTLTSVIPLPPPNVSDFQVQPQNNQALLLWTNPVVEDFSKVVIKKSTFSFITDPAQGATIAEGDINQFVDSDVLPGQTLYYTIFVVDETGNVSSGAIAQFQLTTPIPEEEEIEAEEEVEEQEEPEEPLKPEEPEKPIEEVPVIPALPKDLVPVEMQIPEVTVPEEERIPPTELAYFVKQRTVELFANAQHEVHSFAAEAFTISVPAESIEKSVKTMVFGMNGFSFLLEYNSTNQAYEGTIVTPGKLGKYQGVVIVEYTDGQKDVIEFIALIDPYGYTFEYARGEERRVGGSLVTLSVLESGEWVRWPAEQFAQSNPQVTDEQGNFAFMVPKGTYRLEAKKEGYRDTTTDTFEVVNNVINRNIELVSPSLILWYNNLTRMEEVGVVAALAVLAIVGYQAASVAQQKLRHRKRKKLQESNNQPPQDNTQLPS